MKQFVSVLFAATLVFAVSCGKGQEAQEEEGIDDQALQTAATSTAAAPAAAQAAAPVVADAATITGVVTLASQPPAMDPIQMAADPYCASQHASAPPHDEEVVTDGKGDLADVFVYLKGVQGNYPPPSTPVMLDQKGCMYQPHVVALQVGQPLEIRNDDATLHNVHAMPNNNAQFNEGQPVQGMIATKRFDNPEMTPFKVKCDVHGWMKAWMAVMPHPFYAVSQNNGSFTIANVPPGQYTLVAWHERYGTQEQPVTVGPKESKTVNFSFKG